MLRFTLSKLQKGLIKEKNKKKSVGETWYVESSVEIETSVFSGWLKSLTGCLPASVILLQTVSSGISLGPP